MNHLPQKDVMMMLSEDMVNVILAGVEAQDDIPDIMTQDLQRAVTLPIFVVVGGRRREIVSVTVEDDATLIRLED